MLNANKKGLASVVDCLQALTLDREAFHALLGRLDSLRSMWRFEALQRVPLFAKLVNKTKAAVASALGQVNMPKGTAVVTQVSRLLNIRASSVMRQPFDGQTLFGAQGLQAGG